jgi:hypothetical protein
MQADTGKENNTSINPGSGLCKEWVSQIDQPLNTCCIKEGKLKFTKGPPHKLEITVVPLWNWFESQAAAAIHASLTGALPQRLWSWLTFCDRLLALHRGTSTYLFFLLPSFPFPVPSIIFPLFFQIVLFVLRSSFFLPWSSFPRASERSREW